MNENKKVQYLVVDTSAFIRNAALQDIGVNIITEQDVVNEVTNKRQLRRLVVLPYDLAIQCAHPESIKFVTEFAKKTGDYASLSATDIKVIALTYQLENEKVGTDHLRTVPLVSKTIDYSINQAEDLRTPLAGFYMPNDVEEEGREEGDSEQLKEKECTEDFGDKNIEVKLENRVKNDDSEEEESESYYSNSSVTESDYETADSDQIGTEDLSSKFLKLTCEPSNFKVQDKDNSEHNVDDILAPVKDDSNYEQDNTEYNEYEGDEDDDDYDEEDNNDDDGSGWITPKNISVVKKEIDSELLEEKPATVACLTMDFAMQNVLKQIGLNVVALDGRIIKQMKTFIFRCYACYKTTSVMTKVFCPACGNRTLKKVAVTLDDEGNQQIHINFRKPISKKGKRFSLPMPKGGKHASNPILCEDQPVPDQRSTRLARAKNDPLQDDYIAGYSPFIMRDVYSKSAMLGIRTRGSVEYWMKKNPNECRRRRK
ncbi:RNA-binding protein NOB1 [Dufourea novaeangliae]|uniref:RNA-binding protein NOB1 n=1 Tax=Dufourea novaeangliae TaxID=178035 RepID=A0A154P1R4_DUFNO|nr:RNA-binding protein NOB1 [Dufourea novaeangliae]